MKLLPLYEDERVYAAVTLRDKTAPIQGSMALHTQEDAQAARHNRQQLARHLALPLTRWCVANQTHSARCTAVQNKDAGRGGECIETALPQCDALYTKERKLLIGVFSADCVPILLYDAYSATIAAIHAGWPGTVKQITAYTIQRLIETEQLCPSSTQVWIGPCIHQSSFAVRLDVIAQIQALPFDTAPYLSWLSNEQALADNVGLNIAMLTRAGIPLKQIYVAPYDTYADGEDFFSYRRDQTKGRHFSFLYLK